MNGVGNRIILSYMTLILSCVAPLLNVEAKNTDAANKIKQWDLAYGEQLSSLETGRTRLSSNETANVPDLKKKIKKPMRCTTNEPITLDPGYILSSSGEEKNEIDDNNVYVNNNEKHKELKPKEYQAPPRPADSPLEIDDEK